LSPLVEQNRAARLVAATQNFSVANTFVYRRFKDLRTLINAVIASVVPVLQGGVLLVMTMSMFVTVGVELFAAKAPDHFDTFFRGFYTLFGVIAYGRWPDNVDGLNPFDEEGNVRVEIVAYIYLYVVVVVIVLLQVVVAGPVHPVPPFGLERAPCLLDKDTGGEERRRGESLNHS
jgi:peptidoglycan/LPS O-acetylase OafA/YrhL